MNDSSLSEDLLRKLGGWQSLQEARRIFENGGVGGLNTAEAGVGMLTGKVLVGGQERRVVLRWKGDREASGACSCPTARRGVLCAHALALGVAACRGAVPTPGNEAKKLEIETKSADNAISVNKNLNYLNSNDLHKILYIVVKAASGLRKSWVNKSLPILFQRVDNVFKPSASSPCAERPESELDGRSAVEADDLLSWLRGNVGHVPTLPPAIRLEGGMAARFLAWLAERQGVLEASDGTWALSVAPWRPALEWRASSGAPGRILITAAKPVGLTIGPGGWIMLGEGGDAILCPSPDWSVLPQPFAKAFAEAATGGGAFTIDVPQFLQVASALEEVCDITGDEGAFSIDDSPPRIVMEIDGNIRQVTCRLLADYGVRAVALPISAEDAGSFPRSLQENATCFRARNPSAESAALEFLTRWGFQIKNDKDKSHIMNGEDNVLTFYAFMGSRVPEAWELRYGTRWSQFVKTVEVAKFQFHASAPPSAGWLEGEVACTTNSGINIPRDDIQRLLRSGRGYFNAKNGKTVVLDLRVAGDLEEVWQDMDARQVTPGRFRFSALQARYLKSVLGQEDAAPPLPPLDEDSTGPGIVVLRPYQRHGVSWLASQCRHGLGALLADDMGLGKTLQTLIFLEWQRRQGDAGPALVVCPTSLLTNWQDETVRFCPDWRVHVHHGAGRRDCRDGMDEADLVLTTYGLLARDAVMFHGRTFRTVVLDEASLIRNPDAGIAKAAHGVQAGMRVALTGTPVENSARDIWSIMQFVQPGYLGSRQDFRQRCELAMAGMEDTGVAGRLQKRLRPFVLRRVKAEVASDLPSRMENIEWCAMDDRQAELYNSILRESRERISQTIDKNGFAMSRMSVLTALLRLRQVCCDPGLVMPEKFAGEGGGKRETFRELMREALEGNHRVLVFSQFVTMLERLKEDVEALGVGCGWLTGASRDRGEQVRRFQAGSVPVFLLSLKAGGYGLTLTAADTVILYDPWWNPAVEAQAIDRAHRIGQKQVVTAYKLATRGTVEEKILRLQEKKRGLSARMIADPGQMMEGLGESDLRDLLGI